MASFYENLARAGLGQGLGLGWGDEGEAWLRSKLGQGEYETLLPEIRSEYGAFARDYPKTQVAAELAGGFLPGLAAAFAPVLAPAANARNAMNVGRLVGIGAAGGAIGGAGAAEGERTAPAIGGALLGGTLGAVIPAAARGAGAISDFARERLAPSEQTIERFAAQKMLNAMDQGGTDPVQSLRSLQEAYGLGVPYTLANTNPALADLAEAVTQRAGASARKVEEKLAQQKGGARERTALQVRKALKPGDYYDDEQRLVEELRGKASGVYDVAYAKGAVDDPVVNTVLQDPTFHAAFERGKRIAKREAMSAKLRGEDPSKYEMPEIYKPTGEIDTLTNTPKMALAGVPNVFALDYIKRGLDDMIDAGFKGQSSVGRGEASSLKQLRNQFVAAIDRNVPEYRDARKLYSGDMEVIDALREGMNDWKKLDHEQVIKRVASMNDSEKQAYRTGVARDLYSKIMDPSQNVNAAQKVIGSPEMRAKLQPLFDDAGSYKLFEAALTRESQLFGQANRILGGSQTGKRLQMREALEGGATSSALADAVTGGFGNSLSNMVVGLLRGSKLPEQTANKLADMLMSSDPHEVAAVVKLLEKNSQALKTKATTATSRQAGATTGLTNTFFPAPLASEEDQ